MKTFKDLSIAIGINQRELNNIVNYSDTFYQSYYIRQRNKKRYIDSPNAQLKAIQRWVLVRLFNEFNFDQRATGFIKNRGIKTNAKFHVNKKYILCMDILNFFPSIKKEMVFAALRKKYPDTELAYKLSKLCTFNNRLPQGAPTSPALSNLVFTPIDEKIKTLCNKKLVNYSRYADDLTFSSDNKQILINMISSISHVLFQYGFLLNKKKTRIRSGKHRITVTGLIINSGKPTVGQSVKRDIRAKLYNLIIKEDKSINKKELMGLIAFARDIEPDYYKKLVQYKSNLIKRKNS